MKEKIYLYIILFSILFSCQEKIKENQDTIFEYHLRKSKDENELEIMFFDKKFIYDSVLYFSFYEFYEDEILIYREKVSKNSQNNYKLKRNLKNINCNIDLKISRYKELTSTSEHFLTFNNNEKFNEFLQLNSLLFSINTKKAKEIYTHYSQTNERNLFYKALYLNYSLNNKLDLELIENDLKKLDIINNLEIYKEKENYISILFLYLLDFPNGVKNTKIENYLFDNVQTLTNLNSNEIILMNIIISRAYNQNLRFDFESLSLDFHSFIINGVNQNTNFHFSDRIYANLLNMDSSKFNQIYTKIESELKNNVSYTLNKFNHEAFDEKFFSEYYLSDLLFRVYMLNAKKDGLLNINDYNQAVEKFNKLVSKDSWEVNGYTHGYNREAAYSLIYMTIRQFYNSKEYKSALQMSDDFVMNKYIRDEKSKGAINIIHVHGFKSSMALDNFEKSKYYLNKLKEIRSPQFDNLYNEFVENYEQKVKNIDLLINSKKIELQDLGKIEKIDIEIDFKKHKFSLTGNNLFLFFNEDCNVCNLSINELVDSLLASEFDLENIYIVSDNFEKAKEEYPNLNVITNPISARKSLDYFFKSGLIFTQNGSIVLKEPNIPTKVPEFIEYFKKLY